MEEKIETGQMVLRTVAKWRKDSYANPDHFILHLMKTVGKLAAVLEVAQHRDPQLHAWHEKELEEIAAKHLPDLVIEASVFADHVDRLAQNRGQRYDFNGAIAHRGEENASKTDEPPKPVAKLTCAQFPRHPPLDRNAVMLNGRLYDVLHTCLHPDQLEAVRRGCLPLCGNLDQTAGSVAHMEGCPNLVTTSSSPSPPGTPVSSSPPSGGGRA